MGEMQDLKINVTAETAEAEAAIARLRQAAQELIHPHTFITKLALCACGILLVVIFVWMKFYIDQVRETAKAQAFSDAKQEEIKLVNLRMDQREKEWKEEHGRLVDEMNSIRSAPQATRVIEKYIPQTQGTITQATKDQVSADVRKNLPDSAGYTVMPDTTFVKLGSDVAAGQVCKSDLKKCAADKADLEIRLAATEQQRDKWQQQAKGGSKSRRALRAIVPAICGAGGAAIGAGKGGKGAAIGALIGAGACAIFTR